MKKRYGKGLINKIIDKIPFELHIPGYRFCGPGTKLEQRLNQSGINELDQACKEHDQSYANKTANRSEADYKLEKSAWERVKSKDAKLSEKASAWFVTNAMKLKRKMGAGIKQSKIKKGKKIGLRRVINAARKGMKKIPDNNGNVKTLAQYALTAARKEVKGRQKAIPKFRILQVPSISGGFLPAAIPVLAGLSALGSIAGGVSGIAKAISDFKSASNSKSPVPIKSGKGLYVKLHKKGYGIISKK